MFERHSWIRLGALALLLVVIMQVFARIEAQNLYFPQETDFPNPTDALTKSRFARRIQVVQFEAIDGTRLSGWYVPAPKHRPTVVYAHGNGGNIGDRWDVLDAFVAKDYGFFIFDYRGFGQSEGTPSEEGLYKDMDAAVYWLQSQKHVPVSEQIAVGASLGGAVVVDAASRQPFKAVAIHSTFTSAPAVAAYWKDHGQMAWLNTLPLHRVMQQKFDSVAKIGQVTSPLLVAHQGQDPKIPLDMVFELYDAATHARLKMMAIEPGNRHTVSVGVIIEYLEKLMTQAEQQPAGP